MLLTRAASARVVALTTTPEGIGEWTNERLLVNAIVALSGVTPLLTRLYPNSDADVNEFNRVGDTAFLLRELLDAGLMHDDVDTAFASR